MAQSKITGFFTKIISPSSDLQKNVETKSEVVYDTDDTVEYDWKEELEVFKMKTKKLQKNKAKTKKSNIFDDQEKKKKPKRVKKNSEDVGVIQNSNKEEPVKIVTTKKIEEDDEVIFVEQPTKKLPTFNSNVVRDDLWTKVYQPKSFDDFVHQESSVQAIRRWLDHWKLFYNTKNYDGGFYFNLRVFLKLFAFCRWRSSLWWKVFVYLWTKWSWKN